MYPVVVDQNSVLWLGSQLYLCSIFLYISPACPSDMVHENLISSTFEPETLVGTIVVEGVVREHAINRFTVNSTMVTMNNPVIVSKQVIGDNSIGGFKYQGWTFRAMESAIGH